ncbi:RNA polymerase sigma factor [Anaeromyxobacter oryzisoli]|uniref:RNA polymerase sigma factor n=1 Tax=Anaeromyxobacter oryzisoli TaxID=2925408 RepID=UPI001F5636BA|nr:sigma-70 family RNA polymerase sigma factor [Anaeromyxobacter sp. SG63]
MLSPPQRLEPPREGGEQDDAAAVAAALRGDRVGQRALYDRHRPAVARIARGFAGLDADDVDDVIQDTFVRAFQSLAKLEQPARFGPWLLTIARNRALSRLARRRAGDQLVEELSREATALLEPDRLPDPDAEVELELVRRIIAELPEGAEKETVRLFYVEGGLSAREIAARLGVGKSAITMRLERFRAKVKRRLLAEVARLRGEESG